MAVVMKNIDIQLDKASIIALIMETFNIGIFTTLFGVTLWLLFRKQINTSNELLLPTLCLIWILSVAHWGIDIARVIVAFFMYREGPIAYYEDVSSPLEAAKTAVYISLTLTGDFFLIYRCYIVGDRRIVFVILPILCWMGAGVGGYGSVWAENRFGTGGIFFQGLSPWISGFFASSLAANLYCTGFIAFRVLRAQVRSRPPDIILSQKSRVYSALITFLESAATYSTAFFVLFVVYELGLNTQFILLDLTSSLIGITFTMILLRVAMQSDAILLRDDYSPTESQGGRRRFSAFSRGPLALPLSPTSPYSTRFPTSGVSVSRFVEVSGSEDRDYEREPRPQSTADSAKSDGGFAL
ncbi:hypothetical protein MIND_00966700 [Mycena indigotica]|uniref:Uncharacterized protein n=1 Tax=Mycena indigotica TaxID=2126181 RepID=A0A8H6SDB4_9AGAR|nr:uncharacterized protein MIND_00966700 [Mycena indigotica]KAF7297334.1 hypothetical protein MIND_00966700 [Mycena indigotica]